MDFESNYDFDGQPQRVVRPSRPYDNKVFTDPAPRRSVTKWTRHYAKVDRIVCAALKNNPGRFRRPEGHGLAKSPTDWLGAQEVDQILLEQKPRARSA